MDYVVFGWVWIIWTWGALPLAVENNSKRYAYEVVKGTAKQLLTVGYRAREPELGSYRPPAPSIFILKIGQHCAPMIP